VIAAVSVVWERSDEMIGGQDSYYFAVINMANCTCNLLALSNNRIENFFLTDVHMRFGPLEDCCICSSCESIVSKDSIDRVCAS
jgi:hypothetical protein